MKPFLKSIADAYLDREKDLSRFLFLFPNKRSGVFFNRYLEENLRNSGKDNFILPTVMPISDFVENLSNRIVCPRIHLIFKLYDCYLELLGLKNIGLKDDAINDDSEEKEKVELSFESYRIWGETVLSDFNTIDQYLADPEEIFKNVKDYREISTNFLTEEQKEVLEEYFGQTFIGEEAGFWKNFDGGEEDLSEIKSKFISLWRLLFPLYNKLMEQLAREGLSTSGGVYRLAYENLKNEGKNILDFDKVVAIGFNALNKAEFSIFKLLTKEKRSGCSEPFIDFFWDATGPVFESGNNSASKFIDKDMKMFPSPDWAEDYLDESETESFPEIEIITAPANVAQVKITSESLSQLKETIGEEKFKNAKVAIVLPDENLLIPMLYSFPENIRDINLTMGYTFRLSSIYSLLLILRRLFTSAFSDKGGVVNYYTKDLGLLLSHPLIHRIFGSKRIERLRGEITKYHRIKVNLEDITSLIPEAEFFLKFPTSSNPKELCRFLNNIFEKIQKSFKRDKKEVLGEELMNADIDTASNILNLYTDILEEYNAQFKIKEYLKYYEKLLASEKIMFEGEPLKGLQVMGTLETRSLDFEYLYVLSMNERLMPKKSKTKSFIPDTLRKGYGLPPTNYSEELFAYYFYRMISRSKKVTLIYDGRTGGGNQGGVSRYILQLRNLFVADKLKETIKTYQIFDKKARNSTVFKNEIIKQRLEQFCQDGGRNFSATSLSSYRKCEVKFFLSKIMNLDTDPEPLETLDAITIGNVIHSVMMELYVPAESQNILLDSPIVLTKELLENLLKDDEAIERLITRRINLEHFHKKENPDEPLEGTAKMIGSQLKEMVKTIINHDMDIAAIKPIKLWGVEIKERIRIPLSSGRTINFTGTIDRIDEIPEIDENGFIDYKLRIVDYKTGASKIEAENLEAVLKGDYRGEQIFQLFIYAWLLNKLGVKGSENVMTEVYRIADMLSNKRGLPRIEGREIKDYGIYAKEFDKMILDMLDEIFTKEVFEDVESPEECKKCSFKSLCDK